MTLEQEKECFVNYLMKLYGKGTETFLTGYRIEEIKKSEYIIFSSLLCRTVKTVAPILTEKFSYFRIESRFLSFWFFLKNEYHLETNVDIVFYALYMFLDGEKSLFGSRDPKIDPLFTNHFIEPEQIPPRPNRMQHNANNNNS